MTAVELPDDLRPSRLSARQQADLIDWARERGHRIPVPRWVRSEWEVQRELDQEWAMLACWRREERRLDRRARNAVAAAEEACGGRLSAGQVQSVIEGVTPRYANGPSCQSRATDRRLRLFPGAPWDGPPARDAVDLARELLGIEVVR